jgi:atlastin
VQLLHVEGQNGITYNQHVVSDLFLDPKLKDRQVVVISIVGAFRKGKSFLMNYVLRYLYAHVSMKMIKNK